MTMNEPGDRPTGTAPGADATSERRRLDRAPSARYETGASSGGPAAGPGGSGARGGTGTGRSAMAGPLARAVVAAIAGAALLLVVGAVLASTFGLLFVGGAMGAAVGLLLARAAVPEASPGAAAPATRATVGRLAIGLTLVAVLLADIATWLYAQSEGGVLGLWDYLWTAYGPFVPAVPIVAALGAAWGAAAGPVQR